MTGGVTHTGDPPHHLHHTVLNHGCTPPLVGRNREGWCKRQRSHKVLEIWQLGGNSWKCFGHRVWRGLTPSRTPMAIGEGTGKRLGSHRRQQRAQKCFKNWTIGGNPRQNFGRRVWRGLTPPNHAYGHRGEGGEDREEIGVTAEAAKGPESFKIRKIGGNPWRNFGRQVRCSPCPQSGTHTLGLAI